MDIVCLTHAPFEGPAAIADWAVTREHTFRVAPLYEGDWTHPSSPDMVVVMGGPMGIHDETSHPWLAEEKAYLRAIVADGHTRVLGVCLGAQLLADALGGAVTSEGPTEIGWYPVALTEEGRALGVFEALPDSFMALHWHGDRFAIPPEALDCAASEACDNQAFVFDGGRVVGLQFHIEATAQSWSALCHSGADEIAAGGPWVSSAGEMLSGDAPFGDTRELLYGLLDAMAAKGATKVG